MTILDTITCTAVRLAKPPSRAVDGARLAMLKAQELATIARVRAEWCAACVFHSRTNRVPCLEHTPTCHRAARAEAIGVVR